MVYFIAEQRRQWKNTNIIAWPGLHTVDEDMAAEIIMEDFHLTPKKTE